MPTQSMLVASKNSLASYAVLVRKVRQAIARGKKRAEAAVDREKVRTAWETGKLIHEHILLNKTRAQYGGKVVPRLSHDLGMGETEIKYMVEFARAYPIRLPGGELSWAHYKALLAVNDDEQRKQVGARAVREKWSRDNLRREIIKLRATKQITTTDNPSDELVSKRGELYTYQIVIAKLGPWQGKPVVDLGFSNYYRPAGAFPFKEGNIVRSSETGSKNYQLSAIRTDATNLFTYRVFVDEVTDGDTFWALVDLGFGFTTKQSLRLRGLDASEIASRDGQTAKKFLERRLSGAAEVVITSTKSDKYDRYLADLWIDGKYFNQLLIDKSLAVTTND